MTWTDGMLYPVLHRLERLGHVESRWESAGLARKRKYYRITEQGHAQLLEERRQWQAVDATLRGIWGRVAEPAPAPWLVFPWRGTSVARSLASRTAARIPRPGSWTPGFAMQEACA